VDILEVFAREVLLQQGPGIAVVEDTMPNDPVIHADPDEYIVHDLAHTLRTVHAELSLTAAQHARLHDPTAALLLAALVRAELGAQKVGLSVGWTWEPERIAEDIPMLRRAWILYVHEAADPIAALSPPGAPRSGVKSVLEQLRQLKASGEPV
jgi:hypothetical protein